MDPDRDSAHGAERTLSHRHAGPLNSLRGDEIRALRLSRSLGRSEAVESAGTPTHPLAHHSQQAPSGPVRSFRVPAVPLRATSDSIFSHRTSSFHSGGAPYELSNSEY